MAEVIIKLSLALVSALLVNRIRKRNNIRLNTNVGRSFLPTIKGRFPLLLGNGLGGDKVDVPRSINKVGLKMLQMEAANQEKGENILSCPISLLAVMGMLIPGATEGTSEEELCSLFGDSLKKDVILGSPLVKKMFTKSDSEFKMTNLLYVEGGASRKYNSALKEYFDATSSPMPSTPTEINKRVAKETEGKITSLFRYMPEGPTLLINIAFFKGLWKYQFDKENTKPDQTFYTKPAPHDYNDHASFKKVNMMSKLFKKEAHPNIRYGNKINLPKNNVAVDVLIMPYQGKRYSGVFMLPSENTVPLESLLEAMNNVEGFDVRTDILTKTKQIGDRMIVDVKVPKFKAEFESKNMKDKITEAYGVKQAFATVDGLNGMGVGNAFVGMLLHKVVVETDEMGSKCAAVTAAPCWRSAGGAPPSEIRYRFHANRPFLFGVLDEETQALIFVGALYNPEWKD